MSFVRALGAAIVAASLGSAVAGCGGAPPPPAQVPVHTVVQQPVLPPDTVLPTTDPHRFIARLEDTLRQLGYRCRSAPDEPPVTIFCEREGRFRTFFRYTVGQVARLVLSVRFALRTDCGNITPLINSTNWDYNATTFACRDDVLESRSVLLVPAQGLTTSVLDLYLAWWAEMTREQARATGLIGFVD
ncbi:MAG TPA: hypothetical protein VIL20_16435 [Sandaracinaceae bacterium]